jgi:hypothetical protein
MRQNLYGGSRGEMNERLDETVASKNLRHFLNLLARSCYGSTVQRRYAKKIEVIPVLERSEGRFHYHLALRNPGIQSMRFTQMINEFWKKTRWADSQKNITPAYDFAGWEDYIIKYYGKGELEETRKDTADIDWANYHAA